MYPLLSLAEVTPDLELARRLPRRLAYYHLALPIAQDDDVVTLAMASPDQQRVVNVLETVLGVKLALVRAQPEDIKRLLDQVWQRDIERAASGVLYWSDTPERVEVVRDYCQLIAPALALKCIEDTMPDSLAALLERSQAETPALIVASVKDAPTLLELLSKATVSVLVVWGDAQPPQRILHILRGHTPDRFVFDWIIPIAHLYSASITLLATAPPTVTNARSGGALSNNLADLLAGDDSTPLTEYGQILTSMNVPGRVRVRQGTMERVVLDQLSSSANDCPFDLVALATEAYGSFIFGVMQQVENNRSAFLVIKP